MSAPVLRVQLQCQGNSMWYDPGPNGGTLWRGPGVNMLDEMKTKLPTYEVAPLADLSVVRPPEILGRIGAGLADVMPNEWVMTHQRYQQLDFGFPIMTTGIRIYGGRATGDGAIGDAFSGVFDATSYYLILAALICMILAKRLVTPEQSILRSAFQVFGGALRQDTLDLSTRGSSRFQVVLLVAVFLLYNSLVTVFYGTTVTANLAAKSGGRHVETLDDLLRPEFSSVRIWTRKNGFVLQLLKSHSVYNRIEDRIDFYEGASKFIMEEEAERKVMYWTARAGTHVLVEVPTNIFDTMCRMRYSCRDEGKFCNVDPTGLKESIPAAFSINGGWLMRKNLPSFEIINRELMWQVALGLSKNPLKRGPGLYSPLPMNKTCTKLQFLDESCPSLMNMVNTGKLRRNVLDGSRRAELAPLPFTHFQQLLIIYGGGVALASFAFVFEVIRAFAAAHCGQKRKKKKNAAETKQPNIQEI